MRSLMPKRFEPVVTVWPEVHGGAIITLEINGRLIASTVVMRGTDFAELDRWWREELAKRC